MYNVKLPDRDVTLRFPDNVSHEEAKQAIESQWYGKSSHGAIGAYPGGMKQPLEEQLETGVTVGEEGPEPLPETHATEPISEAARQGAIEGVNQMEQPSPAQQSLKEQLESGITVGKEEQKPWLEEHATETGGGEPLVSRKKLEQRGPQTTVREAWRSGSKGMLRSILGTLRSGVELTQEATPEEMADVLKPGVPGYERTEGLEKAEQWLEEKGKTLKPRKITAKDPVRRYVLKAIGQGPQVGTQVGATLAGGPVLGGATIFSQIYGNNYNEARKAGASPAEAAGPAFIEAAAEAGLEQIGIGKMLKGWTPSAGAKNALKELTEKFGTEWFTEFSQAFPEAVHNAWIQSDSPDQFVQKLNDPGWVKEAAKKGAYQGLLTAPYAGAGSVLSAEGKEEEAETKDDRKLRAEELKAKGETLLAEDNPSIDETMQTIVELDQQETEHRKKGEEEEADELRKLRERLLELRGRQEQPSEQKKPEGAPANLDTLHEKGGELADIRPTKLEEVPFDVWSGKELPADLEHPGEEFWARLATASKEISGNQARTENLEKAHGLFRHPTEAYATEEKPDQTEIQVRDLGNIFTLAHETAHNIDWEITQHNLPGTLYHRFPWLVEPEQATDVHKELIDISQRVRPKLWENPDKRAYVSSLPELMADFGAHYMIDPGLTRKIAPHATEAYERRLAEFPEVQKVVEELHQAKQEAPEHGVSRSLKRMLDVQREAIRPQDFEKPPTTETRSVAQNAAARQALTHSRQLEVFANQARERGNEIDRLVPNEERQRELLAVVENANRDPWTGKSQEQIRTEMDRNEELAVKKYRAYMEEARSTVNDYIERIKTKRWRRGKTKKEQQLSRINFLENYFLHTYDMSEQEAHHQARNLEHRWRTQIKATQKRKYPTLEAAVEAGLVPKVTTMSGGIKEWMRINAKTAVNDMVLESLPGLRLVTSPNKASDWPLVDYPEIRRKYGRPIQIGNQKATLLQEGRVAVHPDAKPFIDALFARRIDPRKWGNSLNAMAKMMSGLNNVARTVQLTTFSFFHHQAELFSAMGTFGPRRVLPKFLGGGFWGQFAKELGAKRALGVGPYHIGLREAGKILEQDSEIKNDFIRHGLHIGWITHEGLNAVDQMLGSVETALQTQMETGGRARKASVIAPLNVAKAYKKLYRFMQDSLWNNVSRAKLVACAKMTSDGMEQLNKYDRLSVDDIKNVAAAYANNNFGGQEWTNQKLLRHPQIQQAARFGALSVDWTLSQIKNAAWLGAPVKSLITKGLRRKGYNVGNLKQEQKNKLMGRTAWKHWVQFGTSIAFWTTALQVMIRAATGDEDEPWVPWQNEYGHYSHIDWTPVWRNLPWNNGAIGKSWKERGETGRKYIVLGKAGREIMRWITEPAIEFYNKLAPVPKQIFTQVMGQSMSGYEMPWQQRGMNIFNEIKARAEHAGKMLIPYSMSGGTAVLTFPMRSGATEYSTVRAYQHLFEAKAVEATGGTLENLSHGTRHLYQAMVAGGNDQKLLQEIRVAAERNGINWEKAMHAGLAAARSPYYEKFAHAIQQGDTAEARQAAEALRVLGATDENLMRSIEERGEWKRIPTQKPLGRLGR